MTLQESDVNGAGDLNGDFTSKPDDEPSTPFLSAPSEEYKKLHKEHGTDDLDLDSADLDSDDLDTRCGFWLCQPSFLQPCARITTFTGFYSLAGLITSTLNVYVNSQVQWRSFCITLCLSDLRSLFLSLSTVLCLWIFI